ncbi:collagen-like protein [Paenibacillus sp. J31TS4]|uniref:collagen-like triple helix repeat-containing protein n=1 Tax=Paenibacillus sp. J31TS4 TaxID=2807195 RepID=UPI001BCD9E70|nr:collagen-like protein [Paenibacillus sp. J31TS4]
MGTGKTGTVGLSKTVSRGGSGSLMLDDRDTTTSFGAESVRMPVKTGENYRAGAYFYLEGGAVNMQLRFYDSADKLLASGGIVEASPLYQEGPLNQWQPLFVEAAAPAGAATASIVLVTGKSKKGIAYWDDVTFVRQLPVANGGFEEPAADAGVPGWNLILGTGNNGGLSVSRATYVAGTASLQLTDRDTVNFAAESSKSAVTPLASYTVTADVYLDSGSVQLQARFYRANGTLIPTSEGGIAVHDPNFTSGPAGRWQSLSVTASAPADAAAVSVVAVSGKAATGISYWDNVRLAEEVFVLGTKQEEPPQVSEPQRFLRNAGFEEPAADGAIPGWTVKSGKVSVSRTTAYEGQSSLYIENEANVGPAVNVESDLIDVEEGAVYSLTSSVLLQAGSLEGFYVYVYDEAGRQIPGPTGSAFHLYVNKLAGSADGKWELAEGTFQVQPGGKKAKVAMISGMKKTYQLYLDNISLMKAIPNGGFEQETVGGKIPGWQPVNAAADAPSFSVTDEKFAVGTHSLKLQNTPGKYLNVISDLIPVEPGMTYTAMARTFVEYGSADMYVRYFDADGRYLNKQQYSIKAEPTGSWFTNAVKAEVPSEARYAAILFAGSPTKTFTYYVDDVKLVRGDHIVAEEPVPVNAIENVAQDLGVQVRKATIMRGDLGKYGDGRDVLYTVVQGSPSIFTVIDVSTEQVIASQPLPNTEGAWSVKVSSDGSVYLGAYNLGLLYRYIPSTGEMKNLGHPLASKDAVLYPMDTGKDGKMYGGTYSTGSIYEYDPATDKFTDFGTMAVQNSGERWVRVTVVDPETNKIYAGVGNQPRLVEYDMATGTKKDLLPEKYRNIIAVYDLNLVGGKLFARKEANNSFETFVLDARTGAEVLLTNGDTGEQGYSLINYSRGVSPKSPIANKLYYAGVNGKMFEYDLDKDTYRSLGVSIDGAAIAYGYLELQEEGFPGYSLVGLSGNGGKMFKYNLATGNVKLTDVALPAEPIKIHDIGKGPDGKIYTTGYLAGNVGVHTPTSGTSMYLNGISQSEGMTVVGNKMYFGIYPDAKIYEYDLAKPWNRDNSDKLNPVQIFTMSKNEQIPGYTLQDRPFAMAGADDRGKLFVGTVPKNALLGGALAVYDVNTRTEPEIYWNLVPDQSILSLVYKDGMLYGGTSIHGGQGGTPKAAEAVLFMWDVDKKEMVYQTVPVPGKQSITALHVGPDGMIWGLANGALFQFDPQTKRVIFSKDAFPSASGRWIDGSFETGTDGNLYATVGGNFFKVDVESKQVEVLATKTQKVAQDDYGHFYLYTADGTKLYKYTDPALILKLTGAELSVPVTKLAAGTRLPLSIEGLLEKGRRTRELAGADIRFAVSDPDAVTVTRESIRVNKPGKVRITATITLDGQSVQSNTLELIVTGAGKPEQPGNPGAPGNPGIPGQPGRPDHPGEPRNPPGKSGTP